MAEALERMAAGFQAVGEMLDQPELRPDPDRGDWVAHDDLVRDLARTYEDDVLGGFREAQRDVPEDAENVRGNLALAGVEVAMVMQAAGRGGDAMLLLGKLRELEPPSDVIDQIRAAEAEPARCARVHYARTLLREGDRRAADALAKEVIAETNDATLKKLARQILDAPRELSSAPSLWTVNGFGVSLYGERDPLEGTVVKTHCVSALFIPILPLSAYRVVDYGDGHYGFLSKVKLSGFATWYRRLLLGGLVALIAFVFIQRHLDDPSRKAGIAFDDAASLAEDGDREAAIDTYEGAIAEYHDADADVLARGAGALAALYAADLPDPFTVEATDRGVRVMRRFAELPLKARTAGATGEMLAIVDGWVDDLGDASPEAVQASLTLLDEAAAVAATTSATFDDRRPALTIALAERLAPDWPLAALDLYLELGNRVEGVSASESLVAEIAAHPSLLRSASEPIHAWLDAASGVANAAVRDEIAAHLAAAEALDPARAEVLESRDEKAVAAYLAEHPDDQDVAVVRADLQLARGDVEAAEETLTALGAPGWLIPEAQRLLASIYSETGRLAEADALLGTILGHRLPRYQKASRAYWDAADAVQQRLIDSANTGYLPPELEAQMMGKTDEEQQAIFSEYLRSELETDPRLNQLRGAYMRYSDVVPLALTLGTIKLRRASGAGGAEKEDYLADAEKVFLAIRQDAEGLPEYHLGLGQVYYRLGKPDEGEAELQGVIDRGEPRLTYLVARAYRDLGQESRARAVAEAVYETGDAEIAPLAASLLGVMATDNDDAEMWFSRSDQSNPFVKTSLLEIKARRLFEEGKYGQAERLMAQAAAQHEKDASQSSASANNAAIAHLFRYACTGDLAMLERARVMFDQGLRLEPDSALMVGNTADFYWSYGIVQVLGEHLRLDRLRGGTGSAEALLDLALVGPKREQLLAALRANANIRKALSLLEQAIVLAPNRSSAYGRAYKWHAMNRDVAKLRQLAEQVEARGSAFDNAATVAARDEWVARVNDEQVLADIEVQLARWRGAAKRAGGHGPTRAAAQAMLARTLHERAMVTDDPADARAAADAWRASASSWDGLGVARGLADALLLEAMLSAAAGDDRVAEAWRADGRRYSLAVFLHRTPAAAAAVKGSDALAEIASLRTQAGGDRPRVTDWIVGRLAGDADLERAGAAWFTDEQEKLEVALDLAFDPDSPENQATAELLADGP